MRKVVLILIVFALGLTFGFVVIIARADINPVTSAPDAAQLTHGHSLSALFLSTSSYLLANSQIVASHLRSWFEIVSPSPSSMLFIGGVLLLFGAFLRRRTLRS